jgi:hypothetical protein
MIESPELVALRKRIGGPIEGLPAETQKQIAVAAVEQILDGIEHEVVALEDWEKRCLAEALEQLRGRRYELARAAARRTLWPEENRRAAEIRRLPVRPGLTTLDELRRALSTAREIPPALSFAKGRASRDARAQR